MTLILDVGWRWASWVSAIFGGINLIGIVFLFPETRYSRSIDAVNLEDPSLISDKEDVNIEDPNLRADTGNTEVDKPSVAQSVQHVNRVSSTTPRGVKKTWLQTLSPWSGTANHGIFNHFVRCFPLLAYPAVAWACLTYSVALAWLIGAGTLSSFIFQVPPYNFSPGVNGLIGLPGLSK